MSSTSTSDEATSLVQRLAAPGINPDGHVVVRLDDEDHALAHYHGARRVSANKHKKDRASYRNGLNEEDRIANIDAVLCEVAVARHLGINWDWAMASWEGKDHWKYRHRADVGDNIEVRRIRGEGNQPSLRPWQVREKRANPHKPFYLFVAYAMPPERLNIKILGWRDYDEAWALAQPAWYDKQGSGSRTLAQEHLHQCRCVTGHSTHFCVPQNMDGARTA